MLPGFIPLFVFIAADEIWGTVVGLYVALGTGIIDLIYWRVKEKHFDRFIILDTGLLVVLGCVSILLHDDVFFKLKPAFIGVIFCLILGLSGFTNLNIISGMTHRYLRDMQISDLQYQDMKRSMRNLFYIFSIQTLLVFYSALYMSKEAWGFISGILFYALFFAYMAFELIRKRILARRYAKEEWLPLVDEKGNVTGQAPRSLCHQGKHLLHPVVHLHVIGRNKILYLQKRPLSKLVQPGKWDTAVGGHISAGEKLDTALGREAHEEIGLSNFQAQLIETYQWTTDLESELVYMFITHDTKNIGPTSDEVEEGRFWSPSEIERSLGKGVFTPNFEHEYPILKKKGFI